MYLSPSCVYWVSSEQWQLIEMLRWQKYYREPEMFFQSAVSYLVLISLFSCIAITILQSSTPFYSVHLINAKDMEGRIKYFSLINDKVNLVLLRLEWSIWNIKEEKRFKEKHVHSLSLLSINIQKHTEILFCLLMNHKMHKKRF